jgi:hypothetical protein
MTRCLREASSNHWYRLLIIRLSKVKDVFRVLRLANQLASHYVHKLYLVLKHCELVQHTCI